MGTTKFFGGMRTLFTANRNGVVTTREFYDTMVEVGAPPAYLAQYIRL